MIARAERRHTILIIDGSPEDPIPLQKILQSEGYDAIQSSDPRSALKYISENIPDLIVLDISRKDSIWLDLCDEIKRLTQARNIYIPIILLTDPREVKKTLEGFEKGADEFIIKPTSSDVQQWNLDQDSINLGQGVDRHTPMDELFVRLRALLRIRDAQENLRQEHQMLSRAHRAMKKELGEVWNIQQSFLSKHFPHHPELRITAKYHPTDHVGGDYYDVIELDDSHWGVLIADIAGHGASAAVVMALTHMTVREFAPGHLSPSQALTLFNQKLNFHLASDHFITMFYGVLDLRSMRFLYASAGHTPPLHYCSSDHQVHALTTEPAFPLRTFENIDYEEREIEIQPGDHLLFYTDGVTESQNSYEEFYGVERLAHLFQKYHSEPPERILERIMEETHQFRGSQERVDDVTLMLLDRRPQISPQST